MPKFLIQGGYPLSGSVKVSGSKNAALPILAACLLTQEKCVIKNVPAIADIRTLIELIQKLGASVTFEKNTVTIQAKNLKYSPLKDSRVLKLRASILLLAPCLARFKKVRMAFPGGCVIGKRSVWAHLEAFRKLGAQTKESDCELNLSVPRGFKPNEITMSELSVTGTENAIMAAVTAPGKTTIRLAAAEPHVQDLCRFLNKMGAQIKGIGTHTLEIRGGRKLKGVTYTITGDYIETGTLVLAAVLTQAGSTATSSSAPAASSVTPAATSPRSSSKRLPKSPHKTSVRISGFNPHDLDSFWNKLSEANAKFKLEKNGVIIYPTSSFTAIEKLKTSVYPGFPTDLHAPFAVLLTQARGQSYIFETLFERRLNYLTELKKMGAQYQVLGPHQVIINGPTKLKAIPVKSCDIRAGAAMLIAALIAKGKTKISQINYIDRGYECLDEKLRQLGAKIERVE